MNRTRIAIGTTLFAFSVTLVLRPGGVPQLPSAYFVMANFGLAVALAGFVMISKGKDLLGVSTPRTETNQSLSVPGADIEKQLEVLSTTPDSPDEIEQYRDTKNEVTDKLRDLTVAIIIDRYGIDNERAQELLDRGTWCEDPHAVAFFIGQYPEWAPSTVRYRANSNIGGFSLQTQAGHVIDVLAAMESGEVDPPGLADKDQETGGETP